MGWRAPRERFFDFPKRFAPNGQASEGEICKLMVVQIGEAWEQRVAVARDVRVACLAANIDAAGARPRVQAGDDRAFGARPWLADDLE